MQRLQLVNLTSGPKQPEFQTNYLTRLDYAMIDIAHMTSDTKPFHVSACYIEKLGLVH